MTTLAQYNIKNTGISESESLAVYTSIELEKDLLSRLAKLRRSKGDTQEDVAKKMGTSKSNISRLEKNVHSPTLSTLREYVKAMGYQFKVVITELEGAVK